MDRHPEHGGRFVLELESADPLAYALTVYLPGGVLHRADLRWDDAGQPRLEPDLSDPWARDETLKLARVARRTPKARITRWRGR